MPYMCCGMNHLYALCADGHVQIGRTLKFDVEFPVILTGTALIFPTICGTLYLPGPVLHRSIVYCIFLFMVMS